MDYEDESTMGAKVEGPEQQAPEEVKALVKCIQTRIKHDLKHHKDAFKRMREDMHFAKYGCDTAYLETGHYKANIVGRHIQQKTAKLYAKNPKAVARRRETLDFQVWDEKVESLQMAMMAVQQAQQLAAQAPSDPLTGESALAEVPDNLVAALEQANAVIEDWSTGMQRRRDTAKIGKTLEILFAQALREQKPVDFKTALKQVVRRASTTGVGYVELGFQRELGPRPVVSEKLADFRARLDHIARLQKEVSEGDQDYSADIAELNASILSLQSEEEIVLREGLIFDYPQSTKVIPDCMTQQLTGFVGARHITVEYAYTVDQVQELFSVDLKQAKYIGYSVNGKGEEESSELVVKEDGETDSKKGNGLVRVWKHYDKVAGLVHYLADGYENFLRESAAPDVFVEDFWPVYALTFNNVEHETELYPLSDVRLLRDSQEEYNRSRQGMREHRKAARPRWIYAKGTLDEEDIGKIATLNAFESLGVNASGELKVSDLFQALTVPGVDPNLYETGQLFSDMQVIVGAQEAQLGGVSQATATESAIAESSSASSNSSSVDDLDAFLTMIARASGQVLMREMSPEKVAEIAGPGALWPEMTLAQIAGELFLEVEAGSSGKPNQAIEMQNWQTMLPFLVQMPSLKPEWLLRETLRRLDDRMDLTEALTEGIPSIIAQNQIAQAGAGIGGDPASDPNAQGSEGANNAPKPQETQGGSDAAFGSNQV